LSGILAGEHKHEKIHDRSLERFFFLVAGSIIWLGIWLTGFGSAHWVLYIPGVFFYFAAITGICPGIIISRLIFPDSKNNTAT
jgi:hypothetical protein